MDNSYNLMEHMSARQYAMDILRLSQRMYQCAQEKSWQDFSVLETERHAAIESLFMCPDMPAALPDVAELLNEVIHLDSKSMALGEAAQHQAGREVIGFKQARRAVHAYKSYSH